MVENVYERAERAKLCDSVYVIWPKDAPDRAESDLIGRHLDMAKKFNANIIVRVPSDNPCIEPGEIDRLTFEFLYHHPTEYLWSNTHNINRNGYPDGIGCEIYAIELLEWMDETLKKPEYREHLHKYFYDKNRVKTIRCPNQFAKPDLRLDVNTYEDYLFIKDIYDNLKMGNKFHISNVIKYLDGKYVTK